MRIMKSMKRQCLNYIQLVLFRNIQSKDYHLTQERCTALQYYQLLTDIFKRNGNY